MSHKTKISIGILAFSVGGAAIGCFIVLHGKPADAAIASTSEPAAPDQTQGVATVTTAIVRAGDVAQTLTAYGSVTAEPGEVTVLSVAVESRARRIRVAGGQSVDRGQAVIEVEPSPDTQLQLIDARSALAAAKRDATNIRERIDMKLATTAEMQQSQQAVESAQTKLDDLIRRGAGEERRIINSDDASIVSKIDVQEGQLVPAGAALIELVPRAKINVRLGIEPADIGLIRPDRPVQLFLGPSSTEAAAGTVRLVTHRVNPDTRLVDLFVDPPAPERLLLDSFVRGELTTDVAHGLVVPRTALLPDDQGFMLFTVKDGHAVKQAAKIVVQNDREAVVTADNLHEGSEVVVSGNLELDDGDPVSIAPAAEAGGAATEPAKPGEDK